MPGCPNRSRTGVGLVLIILAASLAGCAGSSATKAPPTATTPAYNADAHVLIPQGDSTVLTTLKQRLAARGWSFAPYTADMTRGIDDYRAMAQRARYRLTVQATEIGACDSGQSSYRYRVALIENASGEVPITLSGADCLGVIDSGFADALQQHRIVAGARPSS
ncbi:hypothetical protein SAJA_11305 [Salinisphaera japonica YTM-1]|uniref:Lipoprotein n=1 Tax=Salinisphaera japonica YTM-1 TaxID=1209778 RepID=A0A423PLJ2_9GAMM|nr:hypothetical protein SAJA_11305 [Salinisphaera japonica YTM-1]